MGNQHSLEESMSDEIKNDVQAPEVETEPSGESLPESELEKVAGGTAGGKVTFNPFSITRKVDKASPNLFIE
jgi:type VI protein secretion system component Hcp